MHIYTCVYGYSLSHVYGIKVSKFINIYIFISMYSVHCTLLEINGITLIKKWYNPVASWYTIYGITKKKTNVILYN